MVDEWVRLLEKLTDAKTLSREERASKIGAFLRQCRERRGMSVRELARRAGVSHSTVSRTERGLQLPASLEQLLQYARALDLSLEEEQLLLDLAGYRLEIRGRLLEKGNIWRDHDFLSELYRDAVSAFEAGDLKKSRLYLTKIVSELRECEERKLRDLYARANILLSKILNLQDRPLHALRSAHEAQKAARLNNDPFLDIEATHHLGVVFHKVKLDENALICYDWVWRRMVRERFPQISQILLMRDVAAAMINLREFNDVLDIVRNNITLLERTGDVKGVINFREIYSRSLATEFRLQEAEREIVDLWAWVKDMRVLPIERTRLLVILFKVYALKGDIDAALFCYRNIMSETSKHQLFGQIRCLESIAREVLIYRGDDQWLKRVTASSSDLLGGEAGL